MSIPVALEELTKTLQEFDFAYLLTTADEGGPHVVAARPRLDGDAFTLDEVGRRTRSNAVEHGAVTLVWPPADRDGYSLIVDGEAAAAGEGLRVTPRRAVLHRPAPRPGLDADAADASSGCVSDCVELPLPGAAAR
jgi:hypothetical protein